MLLIIIFFVLIAVLSEKCWYLKDKLKISCGNHFESNNFYVNWNFRNSNIGGSINKFCTECTFYDNLDFELETEKVYKVSYEDETLKIFNTRTQQILFDDYSTIGCFSCFKNLYN